jgi:hypothetical protein
MQLGIHLVRRGLLSAADFVDVVERQLLTRKPLGELAIETHKLSMHQLFAVLEAQSDIQRPFGAIAVERGFLKPEDVEQLLGIQSERMETIDRLVVEMGLLDAATVERERVRYRRTASGTVAALNAGSAIGAMA